MVVSKTTKGKGVSFMENVAKWHHGVPTKEQFEQAVKRAREISESNAWFMPNQFSNKLNSLAHYETTAPEILRDLGMVDIFVSGVGSGGSITGVARYLKEKNPDTRVVAVHPPHLQLRQEPQGTSDFRVRSQGPCRLGTGESGLVLG